MQEIKPVYVMQLPHVHQNENSFNLWVEELRSLRTWLEKNLDTTITDEGLWKAIDEINQETAAAKAICDINQMDPPPISGLDLLTITWSRSFSSNKAEVIEMLKGVREEYINNAPTDNTGTPRVLLTGCPVGLGSEKVVRLIEEAGGSMVAMENCSGYKTLELQTERKQDDPIVALARKYLQIPCSCMTPNPYRMELLERMIEDFRVDAVIDLTWQACHTYNIEAHDVGRLVKSKNIPFLHLESDYSNSDLESLKVRIEALLEMVEK